MAYYAIRGNAAQRAVSSAAIVASIIVLLLLPPGPDVAKVVARSTSCLPFGIVLLGDLPVRRWTCSTGSCIFWLVDHGVRAHRRRREDAVAQRAHRAAARSARRPLRRRDHRTQRPARRPAEARAAGAVLLRGDRVGALGARVRHRRAVPAGVDRRLDPRRGRRRGRVLGVHRLQPQDGDAGALSALVAAFSDVLDARGRARVVGPRRAYDAGPGRVQRRERPPRPRRCAGRAAGVHADVGRHPVLHEQDRPVRRDSGPGQERADRRRLDGRLHVAVGVVPARLQERRVSRRSQPDYQPPPSAILSSPSRTRIERARSAATTTRASRTTTGAGSRRSTAARTASTRRTTSSATSSRRALAYWLDYWVRRTPPSPLGTVDGVAFFPKGYGRHHRSLRARPSHRRARSSSSAAAGIAPGPAQRAVRRRVRLGGQHLRRRHEQQPHPEVRRAGQRAVASAGGLSARHQR